MDAYIFNQNPPTPHLSNPWAINGTNNLRPINDFYNSSHVYEYVVAGSGTQFNFSMKISTMITLDHQAS